MDMDNRIAHKHSYQALCKERAQSKKVRALNIDVSVMVMSSVCHYILNIFEQIDWNRSTACLLVKSD